MAKIWWDAGHGGADPGAVANGLQEKDITLKIVKYAMAYMDAHYVGFEQRATRLTDTTVELTTRDDAPDAWGADLFICPHINAGKGTGFESHIYTGAGSATISLQNVLHNEILAAMRQFGSITDRGKKRSDFFVLRETKAKAVLTENLFIDSNDFRLLSNEAFIKAVGEAHARGAAKYLGLALKPPDTPKTEPAAAPATGKLYRVQVGAFSNKENAEQLLNDLAAKGYKGVIKYE